MESAALRPIDEGVPFVVECDASETTLSATLNQRGRPVAFMSRTLLLMRGSSAINDAHRVAPQSLHGYLHQAHVLNV